MGVSSVLSKLIVSEDKIEVNKSERKLSWGLVKEKSIEWNKSLGQPHKKVKKNLKKEENTIKYIMNKGSWKKWMI